jgi:alcohol dehydrogenase (cytochrome c)
MRERKQPVTYYSDGQFGSKASPVPRSRRCAGLMLMAWGLLLAPGVCAAQVSKNPQNIEQGRLTFRLFCGSCHGMNAQGGRGPDLTRGNYANGDEDADLFRVISRGVSGTEMPSFGARIPEQDIWNVISFLRSTGHPATGPVAGNPAAGQKLFWGEGGCGQCHAVGNRGRDFGPDLSRVGSKRSLAYLRQSILSPSADISPGYRTVSVVTRDGRTLSGLEKVFDDFSVALMDANGKLHSFRRSDLVSSTLENRSLMPDSYGRLFSKSQIDDLVAYLVSLRGGAPGSPPPIDTATLSAARLLKAQGEPSEWLMYDRNYSGWRYSPLTQISTANVAQLRPQWVFQPQGATEAGRFETTPLVYNGIMYLTGSANNAYAVDLQSGQQLWHYQHDPPPNLPLCCGEENRGFAALGNRLLKVNIEGDLVALDALTGRMMWKAHLGDYQKGYSATAAPLVVKNMVLTGVAGGDFGARGFIDAYDAESGKRLWRFYTVPEPGEPASDTWPTGSRLVGGATWVTGTYDPELNLVYWGTGNPGPDFIGDARRGDNLYTCSLVALDPDTGKLKWYYQFTPHDTHDWDANATPVLVDLDYHGQRVKALIQADRNGFFYALNRTNGKFLYAKPYTQVSWAKGIGPDGRPILVPGQEPTPKGAKVCPGLGGGHNWAPTAYSPQTGLFYFGSTDGCEIYYQSAAPYKAGEFYQGSTPVPIPQEPAKGSIVAMDPATGEIKWKFDSVNPPGTLGILATAGRLVFGGNSKGYVFALDSRTGKVLWRYQTGGPISTGPISYEFNGKQYVTYVSGGIVVSFALPSE